MTPHRKTDLLIHSVKGTHSLIGDRLLKSVSDDALRTTTYCVLLERSFNLDPLCTIRFPMFLISVYY